MVILLDILGNDDIKLTLLKMLVPAFIAILFMQSGFDKIFNYKSNLDYFTHHFKNSPLANAIPLLTPIITALEILAGLVCSMGVIFLFFKNSDWAYWGLILSALAFLNLFFGQRIAKDYAGAASLAPYFAVNIIGLILMLF